MHTLILSLIVMALWLIFTGEFSVPVILTGAALAALGCMFFGWMFRDDTWISDAAQGKLQTLELEDAPISQAPSDRRHYSDRLFYLLLFIPVFFWKILTAAFAIARFALQPSMDFWPGIVQIDGSMDNFTQTTVLGGLITLTPGTLTLDYDENEDKYYVHWIDVVTYGDEAMDDLVTSELRSWVRKIL